MLSRLGDISLANIVMTRVQLDFGKAKHTLHD